mgnify:CR=1 FL=1
MTNLMIERRNPTRDVFPDPSQLGLSLMTRRVRMALVEVARLWQAGQFWQQWQARPRTGG